MSIGLIVHARRRPVREASLLLATAAVVLAMSASAAAGMPAATPAPAPDDVAARVRVDKVSHDPYTNPTAYHQTEVGADTYAHGDTIVSVFQTGRFADGGSTNIGFATSINGGATWSHGFLPKTTKYADPPGRYRRISDPAIAYDAKHDVWVANSLSVDARNALIVNRSVDGGLTWTKPVIISAPSWGSEYDKNWIGCDNWPNSPNYGNCYVEVGDIGFDNRVLMFTSTDGAGTWDRATVAPVSGLGGQPLSQPDGTVIVPFSGNLSSVQSLVSNDGGQTYTGPYSVGATTDHAVPFMRAPALPSAEVDKDGKIYVVWQDCRFRSGCAMNDIVMSTSKNGKNWSDVVRIPIDPTGSAVDHFTPGIGVDPTTRGGSAHLGLTYYYFSTEPCTRETCRLYAGFLSSTDGGATWSESKKVVGPIQLAWLPNAEGRFVGDYISTSIMNGRAFPVIADARPGDCKLGQIESCQQFMVAPKRGIAIKGGTIPVGTETPVPGTSSDHDAVAYPRAF